MKLEPYSTGPSRNRKRKRNISAQLQHRQTLANFLKIANFDQRRPKLKRRSDRRDSIVHDAHEIMLKEVELKSVKRFLKICSK